MDPLGAGRSGSAYGECLGRRPTTPQARPAPGQGCGHGAAASFGLYAPLMPGAAAEGAGGWFGDALALALGAVFAAGWALLTAALLIGVFLQV